LRVQGEEDKAEKAEFEEKKAINKAIWQEQRKIERLKKEAEQKA